MSIQTNQLFEYTSKRNFEKTPEPKSGEKKTGPLLFVIHEHHASRLHWDLRLEKDGVLKSWAVPKGVPETPKIRHLAIETEDHPYDYGNFEGTIPQGQYGAGLVKIWDRGHYTPKVWANDKIEVKLEGKRLHGIYVLVRLKKSENQKNWLLLKSRDTEKLV
ncbi:MAG: 3'-phosphoesterase [Nitrososphaerota archaeon]|jgi:bifunctional non-homologous end joining protein LigD|uniref:DNA polymerase ligase N-terminal domain-containing protein n=1 Tax=Candidatus Bathycorpusculum sp. TaxID=2994959 RepID=UPI002836D46B|nr:3'-phosphoesterase [Candidatus Termitimicrobium sp.]MCL2430991.1 3'-phosphoesterase [Candidatus Termitimicrobium sp.]MDR0493700.1 3'-phosphoesterase [Nitrososphaerota archaeon]